MSFREKIRETKVQEQKQKSNSGSGKYLKENKRKKNKKSYSFLSQDSKTWETQGNYKMIVVTPL